STRVRIRHADGDWRLLEVQGVRPLGSPPVEGMIVTSRDITDRERYSRRLEKSRRRLRRLSHRLLQVQDEQRRRLSRELHDSLAQTLTAIRIRIEGLLTGRAPGTSGPEERGDELLSMVDGALDEVRELSASVRPALVNEGRLVPALREFVRSEGSAADLDVRFRARDLATSPDERTATACMRIAREAVTNVIRHAEADRLTVTLRPSGDPGEDLVLEVADDGRGFRTGDGSEEELGLTGMLERALSVGGTLDVDSRPGRGTRVRARLPLDAS
nr:sensor histidine kinase [Candidatus Palauibacterales bacterium]